MSDVPNDVGWWQAADGKWYPPSSFPDATTEPSVPLPAPPQATPPPLHPIYQPAPPPPMTTSGPAPGPGWWLASDGRWYPPQPAAAGFVTAVPVVYVQAYKSKALAAVFAFIFCGLGIHHFYLGRVGLGVTMLCLWVVGIVLSTILIGVPIMLGVGLWSFIDGIMIVSGSVRDAQGQPLV